MLLGVMFRAALGTTVLQDVTVSVVAGIITALVFPAWTGQIFENVTDIDDEEVISMLKAEGIDRERMSVDRQKVDEALEVTTLTESDVYEINESEYVCKAEVDDDVKESRLQGLKDRLAASEETEVEELQQEIEVLEERINDLTGFRTGTEVQG